MELKYCYWYFKKALSDKICDEILAYGKSKTEQKAVIGRDDKPKVSQKDLSKIRKSNIVWLNDDWIYNEIHPFVRTANQNAGWNFQWDWSESCQFTKYGKGQFYDWHRDSWEEPYNRPGTAFHGKIRKLSMTILLNDPKEYTGGQLEFAQGVGGKPVKDTIIKCKEANSKGSIIVFPSFIRHRVMPVTKGVRYSLVVWNIGNPFI